jgi:Polyketide cyclase / dehydrase and lipid transport
MTDFRYEVDIQASAARIWTALLDVERWPEWTTSVTRAKRLDLGPLTLGSRTELHQPRLKPTVWRITSLDELRHSFAWTASSFGVKIVAHHQVEKHGTCSRVILSLRYSGPLGPLVARVLHKLTWDYLRREGNGLKTHCEAGVARPVSAN